MIYNVPPRPGHAPGSKFNNVFFFHDRNEGPEGIAFHVEKLLTPVVNADRVRAGFGDVMFHRPFLPHFTKAMPAADVVTWLKDRFSPFLPAGSLIVGFGLGGTIAAKYQELVPGRVEVIAVMSPAIADGIELTEYIPQRLSLFNRREIPNFERWFSVCGQSYDLPWLPKNLEIAKHRLAHLISCYIKGRDMSREITSMWPEEPKEETPATYE